MSRTQEINYPPEEIFRQTGVERPNIEHLILWMLQNNEKVEWSDFKDEPISIPQSTLSYYLKSLMLDDCIEKIERGVYRITSKGEERYNGLSKAKKERKLNYPPKAITNNRNYDHWLLWMVYNNTFCKWSDFVDEPLKINQSSLSKNLLELQKREVIKKEDKEYRITQKGKSEYSRMLKLYDLDRQSILDEESKRIKDITKKTIRFFEKYQIEDGDIKFRFLDNVLKLPFSNLRGSLDSEAHFNKVLLFLSMNHPNQYPFYISTKDFSKEYKIDILDLKFNIRQIVEKNIYPVKFFRLEVDEDRIYFFQANEKIEKILSAITEDHVTKFTYLNKLYENTSNGTLSLSLSHTIESILAEICDNLFDDALKDVLRKFLPEYIKYLAYRIETERKLVDTLDKLEGVAWRDIPAAFQSYGSKYNLVEQGQFKYYIDFTALKVLNLFSDPMLEKLFEDAKHLMRKNNFDTALERIEKKIELDPENVDLFFLKSLFLSVSNRHQEAIRFLEKQFKDHPNKNDEELFFPYNYILIYDHLTLAEFDKALEISDKMNDFYPDHPLSNFTRALINGYKIIYKIEEGKVRVDQVLDDVDQAISLEENKKNIAKYYHFKSFILMQLEKYEEALEAIDAALGLDAKSFSIHFMKYNILYEYGKIDEALELVDEGIKLFPEKKSKLLTHKAFLYKKKKNYDKGLDIIDDLLEKDPRDFDAMNNKVYYHLYLGEKEEAKKAGKLLTDLNPEDGNFHDSYGEALTEFGEYEEAIKILQKALELDPLGWFTYNTYYHLAKCYIKLGKYDLARESIDRVVSATNTCFCGMKMREESKEKKHKLLAEIEELEKKS
ncbi:MAG: tetratricopeptide repeat protein [Candidatus Lokiarchaeota archaeon]|nr:tetratricopeptide repeat protein [Candidatus Lokiarchaeota archaeon]